MSYELNTKEQPWCFSILFDSFTRFCWFAFEVWSLNFGIRNSDFEWRKKRVETNCRFRESCFFIFKISNFYSNFFSILILVGTWIFQFPSWMRMAELGKCRPNTSRRWKWLWKWTGSNYTMLIEEVCIQWPATEPSWIVMWCVISINAPALLIQQMELLLLLLLCLFAYSTCHCKLKTN